MRIRTISFILSAFALLAPVQPSGVMRAQDTRTGGGGKTSDIHGVIAVSGRVVDEEGLPLPGVGIVLKDTSKGWLSAEDGTFSFSVPSGRTSVVEFSFVGMTTEVLTIDPSRPNNNLRVVLKSANELQGATVNAGYGVIQKRENFAGSAFQVTSEDLKFRPHDRLDNMLAGMVPGMIVSESNVNGGRTSISIRIRGDGSLSASNEPLWVIDGVPVYTGSKTGQVAGTYNTVSPLSLINPDDIEDITVLKDATTTALYGADGSNGVIFVTTRSAAKSKDKKNSFNASVKYGIDNVDHSTRIKYLSAKDWWAVAQEAWTNSGRTLANFPYQDNEYQTYTDVDTDWFRTYVGTGHTFEGNFSVTGGTDKMSNYFSAGVLSKETVYTGNRQNRFSLREKTKFDISKFFSAEIQLDGIFQRSDYFSISGFNNYLPIFSPYNEDGSYRIYNYYSNTEEYKVVKRRNVYNDLAEREYNEDYQNATTLNGSVTLTFKPFKGLTITSQSTANLQSIYQSRYQSLRTPDGTNTDNPELSGYSGKYGVFDYRYGEDLRVNYRNTFGNYHHVSAVAGIVLTDVSHPYLQATGNGFANDYIREISYSNSTTRKGASNTSHSRSLSYLGNASYTYDNRYTLTLTGRRQGVSTFNRFSRWQEYAALAGRWNVHREKFFNVPFVSLLSVRMSYGSNGNSRVDGSQGVGTYKLTGNYGAAQAASKASVPNPSLSWERTYIANPGVNVGLFNGRVSVDLDLYNRQTHDVIYSGRVSSVVTDGSVYRNIGIIENKGIEFAINTVNIDRPNFKWTTYINGARNRNLIKKLDGDSYTGYFDHIWIEGQQKDAMWLIQFAGIDPVSGRRMYYDRNGDLTYTANFADRVYMPQYSNQPLLYGGVSNRFTFFKRWNAQIMFDYTIGGWLFYTLLYDGSSIDRNLPVEYLDRWRVPGDKSSVARIQYKNDLTLADYNTPYDLWNKTSVQLRSLSVGYTVPEKFSTRFGVNHCTVSFVGNNLYFWSLGQSSDRNSYKTVREPYGMTRSFALQFNFSF